MKKLLITGSNSYIGTSVEKWLLHQPEDYAVETLDMENPDWKQSDFSLFDTVFHVAGIAHISADPTMEDLYFRVNRDLALDVAKKAKKDGVGQLVFMSTIAVYGERMKGEAITKDTMPEPQSYYGAAKHEAENLLMSLCSEGFQVSIVRAPMVYGKDSTGNYSRLSRLAKKSPFFPKIENQRSMIHIDNLSELIRLLIDHEQGGLFFPQNRDYVSTSQMVQTIAQVSGKKIRMTRIFNWLLKGFLPRGLYQKVFGDLVFDKSMSQYDFGDYQIRGFRESIELSEKK